MAAHIPAAADRAAGRLEDHLIAAEAQEVPPILVDRPAQVHPHLADPGQVRPDHPPVAAGNKIARPPKRGGK